MYRVGSIFTTYLTTTVLALVLALSFRYSRHKRIAFKYNKVRFCVARGSGIGIRQLYLTARRNAKIRCIERCRIDLSRGILPVVREIAGSIRILSMYNPVSIQECIPKYFSNILKIDLTSHEIDRVIQNIARNIDRRSKTTTRPNKYEVRCRFGNKLLVISPSGKGWAADPFIISIEKKFFLLFEEYIYNERKGIISCINLTEDLPDEAYISTESSLVYPLIETTGHLAFPYPSLDVGDMPVGAILPDQYTEKGVNEYPVRIKNGNLVAGIHSRLIHTKIIDPVIVARGLKEVIVIGSKWRSREGCCIVRNPVDTSHNTIASNKKESIVDRLKFDIEGSRSAGRLVVSSDGILFRPTQITAPFYGAGILIEKYSRCGKLVDRYRLFGSHHIDLGHLPEAICFDKSLP